MQNTNKTNPLLGAISAVSFILPLSLATGVCSGFGVRGALVCAVVAALCGFCGSLSPAYLLFLQAMYISASNGVFAACIAGVLACAIYFAASFCDIQKLRPLIKAPAVAGLGLACAFSLTALQTTNYFGIGAAGNTVLDMLVSYRSLGFHANWRGVLYGTIVMVIMITFPRAFKKFSKTVSPAFIALAATLLLNLFLNPVQSNTAIDEIGEYGGSFLPLFEKVSLSPADIPYIALCSVSMAAVMIYKSLEASSALNKRLAIGCAASCALGGLPLSENKLLPKNGFFSGAVAAAAMLALCLCGAFERIPVHSLAVVIIVGAWQNVEWGKIAASFKGGFKPAAAMLSSALFLVFAGPSAAVAAVLLLSLCFSLRKAD